MEAKRRCLEKSSKTTEPGSSVKALEGYIKKWMSGSREISKDNLRFLASCKNDDEFEQIIKTGHLSL
jgi:hypothetical protein